MSAPTILLDRLYDRLTDASRAVMELRADRTPPGKPLRALRSNLEIASALLRHLEGEADAGRVQPYRGPGDSAGDCA